MNDHRERAYRAWAKFLNPEVLRGNLIAASIFLAAFEILRTSIIDQIRSFFTHGFDQDGWIVDEDYQAKVLSLDKSPLRASLLWLKEMSVLDDADIASVDHIRQHRNELAHSLPKFLGTPDAEINMPLLGKMYELVAKIDRWWIREVDLPTKPDYDGREVADEDMISGNMFSLQLMIHVATGGDSNVLWEEFQKQAGVAWAKIDKNRADGGSAASDQSGD
jgi:hypothetical protein